MNVLQPRYDCIPDELKARNQWVCWLLKKTEQLNGKVPKKPFTKIPICPLTGTNASTTEPTTWTDFGTACTFYQDFVDDGGIHGLGFILRDDLIGVDLDGCRDAQSGEIAEWATKIINLLDSYTEISPSGTGIRIFCTGQPRYRGSDRRKGDIEIYDCNSPRYLTVTGWHLDGTPTTIEKRQGELEKLYFQVFPANDFQDEYQLISDEHRIRRNLSRGELALAVIPSERRRQCRKRLVPQSAPPTTMEEIVARATAAKNGDKFTKLWGGDWSDYPSQSEADLALAAMLAFYIGPNEELLDEMFRQSGLYRDKWDRDDYRERVLAKAMDRDEFYNAPQEPSREVQTLVAEVEAKPVALVAGVPDPITQLAHEVQAKPTANLQTCNPIEQLAKDVNTPRIRTYYTLDGLNALPPLQWQVHGHFSPNSFTVIFGQSGHMKSFFMLDCALSVAAGIPFCGMFPTQKGAVAYVASEGGRGMKARCNAWVKTKGHSPGNFIVIPDQFDLSETKQAGELLATCKEGLRDMPSLIVIDTLGRNFGGGDENSTQDMGRFCNTIDWLREKSGATLVMVHHTGWGNTDRERGAKRLRDCSDTTIHVEKKADFVIVRNAKQKEDAEFPCYKLTPTRVGPLGINTDGEPIYSITLAWRGNATAAVDEFGALLKVLPYKDSQFTIDDVAGQMGSENNTTFRRMVARAIEQGFVATSGKGTKGSPLFYRATGKGSMLLET